MSAAADGPVRSESIAPSDTITVRGGIPVEGRIAIRGSKNALPKAMVAALLTTEPCRLTNIAEITDIDIVDELIRIAGGSVERDAESVTITAHSFTALPEQDVMRLHNASRIPVLTTAVSLHRTGHAVVAAPGGCSIGPRPVDFHLSVLRSFGARDDHHDDVVELRVDTMRGARIELPFPSVGATEQFLFAAVLAEGDSELANAAIEPEILDLISVLQKMGALISVEPNRTIRVTGVDELGGFEHRVIGDRLEAASWASLALATGGVITVTGVQQQELATFLNVFRRAGGDFTIDADGDTIAFRRARPMLRPLALETDVHPGFMTDWQSPFVTALTQADGVSVIHETVYEDRLGYTEALRSLGAQIQVFTECLGPTRCRFGAANHRHSAVVVGPTRLHGAELVVPDLRAGFSYVIAAAAAEGESLIHGVDLLDRGYADFRSKLSSVGIDHR
ncbi:MAG: UDP-N-acetylglucosamine 1-carboxyvinyltransferase [Acidobacteria bacterium]|nr:UDP-N-acetylglucosamine 1-carboxyvinyltransferase [Acidobacteriota bacterium]